MTIYEFVKHISEYQMPKYKLDVDKYEYECTELFKLSKFLIDTYQDVVLTQYKFYRDMIYYDVHCEAVYKHTWYDTSWLKEECDIYRDIMGYKLKTGLRGHFQYLKKSAIEYLENCNE